MAVNPDYKKPPSDDSENQPLSEAASEILPVGIENALPESRKIGVMGAVFLILNKMIGTGSMCIRNRILLHTR